MCYDQLMSWLQIYLLSVVIALVPIFYRQRKDFLPGSGMDFWSKASAFIFTVVIFGFLWPVYWSVVLMIRLSAKIMDLVWNS